MLGGPALYCLSFRGLDILQNTVLLLNVFLPRATTLLEKWQHIKFPQCNMEYVAFAL